MVAMVNLTLLIDDLSTAHFYSFLGQEHPGQRLALFLAFKFKSRFLFTSFISFTFTVFFFSFYFFDFMNIKFMRRDGKFKGWDIIPK